MALFRNSPPASGQIGVNHAKDLTGRCGIACAAYTSLPPRNAGEFLELAENCLFLNRKLLLALNETVDGHY
jgi:hypothetical protein